MSESQGERGPAGKTGQTGKPGPQGRRGLSLTNTQVLAVFFVVVVAFVTLSIRNEIQQRQIARNAERIEHVLVENARIQYDICIDRNTATRRQNALIDSAIEAEKRKRNPDAKRIRDLTAFRGAVPSCGTRP